MSRKTICIVDYGVGNHTSVQRAFQALDYRCRTSSDPESLADSDLIVLPGVGAYPAAMSALHTRGLVEFLREQFGDLILHITCLCSARIGGHGDAKTAE